MAIRASGGNELISSWWKQCLMAERRHQQLTDQDVQSGALLSEPGTPSGHPCCLRPHRRRPSQEAFLPDPTAPSPARLAVHPQDGRSALSVTLSSCTLLRGGPQSAFSPQQTSCSPGKACLSLIITVFNKQ